MNFTASQQWFFTNAKNFMFISIVEESDYMTRIIACISGKGGAGKTTLVANLGVALAKMGKDVTVLDANLTTPNLGLHLGVPLSPVTIHDVLRGKATISQATYRHESGLKIIPAGIALKDLKGVDARDLSTAILDLLGNTEIILIDAAAGLGREALAAVEAADELLLITNPDLPAVTDALKAAKLAEQMGTNITGVIINRKSGRRHEMANEEVLSMLDNYSLLGEVSEDVRVQHALSNRTPVVMHEPKSVAAKQMRKIAGRLVGIELPEEKLTFGQRILGLFRR